MRITCGVAPRVCGSFSPPPGSFPAIVLEAIFHAALISAVGRALSLPLALPSPCLLPPRLPIAIPRLPLAIRPASVARPASLAIAISAAISADLERDLELDLLAEHVDAVAQVLRLGQSQG